MADCNSSSDSATSLFDYSDVEELVECEVEGSPPQEFNPGVLSRLEGRPKLMKVVRRQKISSLPLARFDLDSEEW